MKVNQTSPNSVQSGDASATKGAGKAASAQQTKKSERSSAPAAASKSGIPGANAEISSKGKEIARASAAAANAPDEREDKIAELKQRIASGSYKIDANAIAGKLVDEHLGSL